MEVCRGFFWRGSAELVSASYRFWFRSTKTWGYPMLSERKDFEVYSCDVSLDGSRLVSAAGGEWILLIAGSCD